MFRKVRSTGLFSIAILSGGSAIGMIISAVALILYSRFMGPAEFGLFSVAFSTMFLAIRLADFGTNLAIERAIARVHSKDEEKSAIYIRLALWLKCVTYLIIMMGGWVGAPYLTQTVLHLQDVSLIRLSIVLAFGTIFFEYTTLVFQGIGHFGMIARIMIAQGIAKLIFSLILIWQQALTAFSGMLLYGLIPGLAALLAWKKSPVSTLSLPKNWRKHTKYILGITKWTGIYALSATVADNLDILLVQSYMSSYDVGLWSGAVRIATFATFVGYSVGSVLNVRVARYHRLSDLHLYLKKAWKLSLAVLMLMMVVMPLAELAIKLTIGASYLEATLPLQILLFSAGLGAAAAPYVALFYLFDKPQFYTWFGVVQILTLFIGGIMIIPEFGLTGAAWVRVAMRAFVLLFTALYAYKSYREFVKKKSLAV